MKKIPFVLFSFLLGCFLASLSAEIILRIYDPFEFRVKGNRIVLPVNKKYIITNHKISKLDEKIVHTRNILGFRGDNPPKSFPEDLTIVTIGGSTTECFFLSDGQTWPDLLDQKLKKVFHSLWLNNAGLDGQSTFGHLVLLRDYVAPLRPKVVLFLFGINDFILEQGNANDDTLTEDHWYYHSEFLTFLLNMRSYLLAKKMDITHNEIDLLTAEKFKVSIEYRNETLANLKQYGKLDGYAKRVTELVKICRANGIEPVLITQPSLYGDAIDDITKVDLGSLRYHKVDSSTIWQIIEIYNDITRDVGRAEHVPVVDLAREMPKSSRLFYDHIHFTPAGAQEVSAIVYRRLCPFLSERFHQYQMNQCEIK